jgi:hypothetical protein
MSFFHKKKMSQNAWATIMPFGPVTLIFHWPKKKFRPSQRLALISALIGLLGFKFFFKEGKKKVI